MRKIFMSKSMTAIVGYFVMAFIVIAGVTAGLFWLNKASQFMPNSNRQPYKFRVEISAEKPDKFNLGRVGGDYEYVDEFGINQLVDYQLDDSTVHQSSCIREFDIPLSISSFLCFTNIPSFEALDKDKGEGFINGKLYVDDKLLTEFRSHHFWIVRIVYDEQSKKYKVITSDGVDHKIRKVKSL